MSLAEITIIAATGFMTITWNPNSEADLAGYRVYRGLESRKYTETWTITDTLLKVAYDTTLVYYIAVTAFDSTGNESGFSDEVVFPLLAPEPKPQPEPADSVYVRPDDRPAMLLLEYSRYDTLGNMIFPQPALEWHIFNQQEQFPYTRLKQENNDYTIRSLTDPNRKTNIDTIAVNLPRLRQFVHYDSLNARYIFDLEFRARIEHNGHVSAWAYTDNPIRMQRAGFSGIPVGIIRFKILN